MRENRRAHPGPPEGMTVDESGGSNAGCSVATPDPQQACSLACCRWGAGPVPEGLWGLLRLRPGWCSGQSAGGYAGMSAAITPGRASGSFLCPSSSRQDRGVAPKRCRKAVLKWAKLLKPQENAISVINLCW